MHEKELQFDRSSHVCYSPLMKTIIRDYLQERFPQDMEALWEKVQLQYVDFLSDLPYQGGAKCTHNGPGGTYDCIALFALYEVLPQKPSLEELYRMNNAAFLPSFKKLGKIADMNHSVLLRIAHKAFTKVSVKDAALQPVCPSGYIMKVEPFDKKSGIHYRFDRCPIAEFARAHGYTSIMPAFCNGDYPALELLHAGLIRQFTCANSDHCDYWIVGDQSPYLKQYPMQTDAAGFFYNEIDPQS